VPIAVRPYAYSDQPLPIGFGQSISQPYIVALMTELLAPKKADRVLEIGTGSGYQTAVLARLSRHVYSIEIVAALAKPAKEQLAGRDGLWQRHVTAGRRIPGLARRSALRPHTPDGGLAGHSRSTRRSAHAGRQAGRPGRWKSVRAGTSRRRQIRHRGDSPPGGGAR